MATLTGSINRFATRYVAAARNQTPGQELIDDLASMTEFCMKEYVKTTTSSQGERKLPEKLIYYRDGVSEGQFDAILEHELPAIRKGIQRLAASQDELETLKITICVVRFPRLDLWLM